MSKKFLFCLSSIGTVFVIICSMIVHYTNEDEDTSKFVDPLCSILSCVVLMTLSYPYSKFYLFIL